MMMIEDFGARIASVWRGLRPATRSLVERALVSAAVASPTTTRAGGSSYDARAEWELSRLLAALDDRATEPDAGVLNAEQARELVRMAETCAQVLHKEARSAEVFGQLFERALRVHNYARVDTLADTLSARLAPSEMCELARHPKAEVRALAREALLHVPTPVLVELLGDPVDSDVARDALKSQADEFDSEEARWIIGALEGVEAAGEDI
ncbi:MAG TPA: hypothetical protein VNA19_16350 [Pyrinomonadaceae bacterium]|jgi:hypothetical protein|nr:hypothetical protein [Pyrinomonadaceae bacterium]